MQFMEKILPIIFLIPSNLASVSGWFWVVSRMLNIRRFGLGWSDPRASSVLGGLAYSKPTTVWSWVV